MANATATLTVYAHPYGVDNTMRRQILQGSCALLAGGTYITGGVPTVWTGLVDGGTGNHFQGAQWSPQTTQPCEAYFYSIGKGETTIPPYTYVWDKTNNALRILIGNTGLEIANGAAITADNIEFSAEFVRSY
jgi:hypothetical protein